MRIPCVGTWFDFQEVLLSYHCYDETTHGTRTSGGWAEPPGLTPYLFRSPLVSGFFDGRLLFFRIVKRLRLMALMVLDVKRRRLLDRYLSVLPIGAT